MLQYTGDNLTFFDYADNFNYHRGKLKIPADDVIECAKAKFYTGAIPLHLKNRSPFIYHSSYYRPLKAGKGMAEVTTVHDFTHDYCFPAHRRMLHNYIKYSAIRRSAGIICISHNTYRDLLKFCPPKRGQEVQVIYNGVSDEYFPVEKDFSLLREWNLQEGRPFLLYVGSRASYKNFDFALAILKELPEFEMVAIGSPFSVKEKEVIGPGLLKRIHLLSNVPDEKLNILYNFAHALLYPSDYEGFGIPVVEAMRSGCPVLALDRSSVSEIAGGDALLYGEKRISDFRTGILQLKDTGFRKELTERAMEQSFRFSWEKCAKETHEFYSTVYRG